MTRPVRPTGAAPTTTGAAVERREAPGPCAKGLARLARRAAGFAKPAKGRFASALAPPGAPFPLSREEKSDTGVPHAFKEQGR